MESEVNIKKFKSLLHDCGIFQQIAGLRISDLIIAEKRQLYYWHREKRGSNAEVDYLLEHEGSVVPVEVISGSTGKMQSLNLYIDEKNLTKGIRISLENFSQYGKITVVPLYAI